MWPSRSHKLAHLTRLTSIKNKFKRKKVEQDAFNKIEPIVTRNTLSTYLDFNETFKINTNASGLQLGEVIR